MSPTPKEITEEKKRILEFCDQAFLDRQPGKEYSYGMMASEVSTPFKFKLWFEGDAIVAVNHIVTEWTWREKGLFSFLLSYLESMRGIRKVGIKSANSPSIRPIIIKRGYECHADNDYIKPIYRNNEIVALERLPRWLKGIARHFASPPE